MKTSTVRRFRIYSKELCRDWEATGHSFSARSIYSAATIGREIISRIKVIYMKYEIREVG